MCSSILESFDLTLPTEPPTPPTKTTEKLKLNLSAVNAQLTSIKRQWEEERQQLLGENAVLHDVTKRLNSEVRSAKDEAKRIAENEKAEKRNQAFTQTVSPIEFIHFYFSV